MTLQNYTLGDICTGYYDSHRKKATKHDLRTPKPTAF
jgi:hypothetical protein